VKPRVCHDCGTEPTTGGVVRTELRNGKFITHCRGCVEAMAPGLVRFQHDRVVADRSFRRLYDIGLEDYERLYRFQNGRCAICQDRTPPGVRLVVDHDHTSGDVRGLLCNRCNLVLGQMEDNKGWLERSRLYLSRPPWEKEGGSRLSVEDQVALRRAKRASRDADKLQATP